ncbi:MAG: hypothetical protein IH594_01125, partial [Bacteroidales bacterium]|nr:hypothetical protein [Bacteroidales bacterium]
MAEEMTIPDKATSTSKFVSRSLIIGLGGSGQNIIKEVRKRIYEKYGEIPRLIDFLAIDTT